MNQRPIVILGGSGHIGYELRLRLTKIYNVLIPHRVDLDLNHPKEVTTYLRIARPSLIINAASFSDIDLAESNVNKVRQINTALPEILATEALERGIALIQFSTDMVFDGRGQRYPYLEEDIPNPQNVFGRSMLRGESNIKAINPLHLILRTSRIYSIRRPCFLTTLFDIFKDHHDVNISSDEYASPTWSRSLADMVFQIILESSIVDSPDNIRDKVGIYNLCSIGEVSWYDYAKSVIKIVDKEKVGWPVDKKLTLRPVDSDILATQAKRPRYSALSTLKAEKVFNVKPTFWLDQLRSCLKEL